MKIKTLFATAVATMMLALGTLSGAPAPQAPEGAGGDEATVTGCLEREGADYTLKAESGEVYKVTGPENLADHVGHTVRITGKKSGDAGSSAADPAAGRSGQSDKMNLHAEKLEHVSASCQG